MFSCTDRSSDPSGRITRTTALGRRPALELNEGRIPPFTRPRDILWNQAFTYWALLHRCTDGNTLATPWIGTSWMAEEPTKFGAVRRNALSTQTVHLKQPRFDGLKVVRVSIGSVGHCSPKTNSGPI